ncbi:MAG: glycosyltransferase [Candidatus Micrarchaeia archaeon]
MVIIPLGLNSERLNKEPFNNKYVDILDKLKSKKIVFSVGRLVEYKGFEYLMEAGRYLDDNVVILIAGDGPLNNKLKRKIKKLNLKHKVIMLGKVNHISIWLNKCDLFCLPSITRNEAFGLVLVEALYFGKPLITINVEGSGMNYINKDRITGFVVPPKDPKAIAQAIKDILSNDNCISDFLKMQKKDLRSLILKPWERK